MGQLYNFKCNKCGYEVLAPANKTGRYSVMNGTKQLFHNESRHSIVEILISHSFLGNDDATNNKEANELLKSVIESGDVHYFDLQIRPPRRRKDRLSPWNVHTCHCPKCGGEMQADYFSMILVD